MKTILFVAELGAGMGHAIPLLRIASALRAALKAQGKEDFRAVYVLHDPHLIRSQLRHGDLALSAPRPVAQGEIRSHTASYAEILALAGFARKTDLEAGLATWDDIFALTAPSVLVADHSPLAVLAARGRIPTLVTGNAFNAPPVNLKQYPALLAHASAPPIQQSMLSIVNETIRQRNGKEIAHLPQVMAGDARAVFMLPVFDPYGPLRDTPLFGTYETGLTPTPPPAAPSVFLYSHSNLPLAPKLVQAVVQTGLPVTAFMPGNESETTSFLKRQGVTMLSSAPALTDILPRVSVVVSHAGAGLSQAAYASGRAQVVVPIHSESQMIARQIEKLGTGICFDPTHGDIDATALGRAIGQVATDETIAATTLTQARDLARLGLPAAPLRDTAQIIISLLSKS
ncbi:MAG: hypothetical protein Q7T44_09920 [Parvibaculum sp.]|nr:hypothetical protein [Parvibaculum sp.]